MNSLSRRRMSTLEDSTTATTDNTDSTQLDVGGLSQFAKLVVDEIQDRFGKEETRRVLESWINLDKGIEHDQVFGGEDEDKESYRQFAHSYVPGLQVQLFWDEQQFEWARKLEKKASVIINEFTKVNKQRNKEKLKNEGNNVWASALTEDANSYGVGWKTLVLNDRGTWDPQNCELFPKTARAVRDSGIPATEVFFASMDPNSEIKPHSDFTNFVLTCHLAIDIPENGQNKCRLTIGNVTKEWLNGKVMLFDTSVMHDAINETDETRYILMFRVWHPDLTDVEKEALQFIYDCILLPDIVASTGERRELALKQLETLRQFPTFKRGSGFGGASGGAKSKKRR